MSACVVVQLSVRAGEEVRLENVFETVFRPAVSSQVGFDRAVLLRPLDGGNWLLEIGFSDERLRLDWVATALHTEVWPRIEKFCSEAVSRVFEAIS